MELRNGTPHLLGQFVDLDRDGAEHMVVTMKATYSIGPGGELAIAEEPEPIRLIDEFHGEPDASSIRTEAELGPIKPSTDVLLSGCALARRANTKSMDVMLRVGTVRKVVRVWGERRWQKRLGMHAIGDPLPIEKVPLIWEHAFGGVDESSKNEKHRAQEPRNPVGRGFRAKRSKLETQDTLLPQLEDPNEPIESLGQRVRPKCFAPICRHWLPRRDYAGTYDETWIQTRMPILPPDFDDRFHHAAPPDQVTPRYLVGGEKVEIVGCTTDGQLRFPLPVLRPKLEARLRARLDHADMVLETVGVDTEARTLRLVYKGKIRVHGELPDLRYIECAIEEESR